MMRHFIKIMETAQQWPEIISGEDLAYEISDMHHTPEDFEDGDIIHNITSYGIYHLKRVPLVNLNLDLFSIAMTTSSMTTRHVKPMLPPIIVAPEHGIITDGNHRANAAAKRGETDILAYVGDPTTILHQRMSMTTVSGTRTNNGK